MEYNATSGNSLLFCFLCNYLKVGWLVVVGSRILGTSQLLITKWDDRKNYLFTMQWHTTEKLRRFPPLLLHTKTFSPLYATKKSPSLSYFLLSDLHPSIIIQMAKIFSVSVLGATLPKPTDMRPVNVKYRAVQYRA